MLIVAPALLWAAIAALAWVYVGYPLLALAFGRLRPVRVSSGAGWPELVTVGLAVHDGARDIEERIANVLGERLPFSVELIVATDGSPDETPALVRRLAEIDPRLSLIELPRVGQSAAQARIFGSARGEVIVLTDAETRFAPGCVEALIAPFSDPKVGCTTGILRWHYERHTLTARHEGLYWRYEQTVRSWESRAGWLTATTGALLGVRRDLYRPVAEHASLDQILPLIAREKGRLVLVVPAAAGSDRGTTEVGDQFASRTRIATQGIEANLRMARHITPWSRPGSFLAIWSHKLLRWATPWLIALATLAGIIVWSAGGSPAYLLPVALVALFAFLASAGHVARRRRWDLPLTGFPMTIVAVNLAFGLSWINVLLRRRVGSWQPHPPPD